MYASGGGILPSSGASSSEASVNQAPGGNDTGPSNAGPSNVAPADSPWRSFPSVPSSLTTIPPSPYVPSVPSLHSIEENNPSGREQPSGAVDQPQEVKVNCREYQHQKKPNRIATLTPQRELNDDQIDALILLKEDVIHRMAQLDPNPFWAEQRNNLVANGILMNRGAEYTIDTQQKNLHKLTTEGQNTFFFKKMVKTRENFELYGRFD